MISIFDVFGILFFHFKIILLPVDLPAARFFAAAYDRYSVSLSVPEHEKRPVPEKLSYHALLIPLPVLPLMRFHVIMVQSLSGCREAGGMIRLDFGWLMSPRAIAHSQDECRLHLLQYHNGNIAHTVSQTESSCKRFRFPDNTVQHMLPCSTF